MIAATPSFMPLLRRLDLFVTRWHRLFERACDSYRPERHYMRGPGPKWYAKHRTEGAGPLSLPPLAEGSESGTKGGQQPQPLHDMALLWSNLAGRVPPWAEDY